MSKGQTKVSFELPSSRLLANANSLATVAENHLQVNQAPTKQVQEVAAKVQVHLAQQSAYGMKTAYGDHVMQVVDVEAMECFAEFTVVDRAIREQPRHELDQADVEGFNQVIRQAHANTLLTLRAQLANHIEIVVGKSLEPKQDKQPTHLIVQKPPFWGVFGGQEVTQLVYDDD